MKQKHLLILAFFLLFASLAQAQNSAGDVWVDPANTNVGLNTDFAVKLLVNSGSERVAAYGIDLGYDQNMVTVRTDVGNNGVEPGTSGFVAAVNPETNNLRISGFDAMGTGPGSALDFLNVSLRSGGNGGTTTLQVTVNDLNNETTGILGNPRGINGTVSISGPTPVVTDPPIITDPPPTPDPTAVPGTGNNPYTRIEGEDYDAMSGIRTQACSEGTDNVGWINDGDWLRFDDLNFGSGAASCDIRVASATNGGDIELRLDSTGGTLIGTCDVNNTGGWQSWVTESCNVNNASGTHDLYMVFRGGNDYLLNVNWFEFTPGGTITETPTPDPTATPVITPVPVDTPTPAPVTGAGSVWLAPADQTVTQNTAFTTDIHVNTGNQLLAAYGIFLSYNTGLLDIDASIGNNGVEPGADGYVSAVADNPGDLRISGFDAMGRGPSTDLLLATVNWVAVGSGSANIGGVVDQLKDETTNDVGSPAFSGANVAILTSDVTPTPAPVITDPPPTDPPPTDPPPPTGDLIVQYRCMDPNPNINTIRAHFKIVNNTNENIPLSELAIRYYRSKEGSVDEAFWCDWVAFGNQHVSGSFTADYVQINIASGAGTLNAGSSTSDIQCRINKVDWTNYDQSNDDSFDPSATTFTATGNVHLYRNGVLVFPGGGPVDTPTPTPTPVTDTPTPTPTPVGDTPTPTPTPTPVTDTPTPTPVTDTPTPTPTPVSGQSCDGVPVWTANDIYPNAGMRVQYNGNLYDNNWYTQNQNPEQNSGQYEVWNLIGPCGGGPVDTPTPVPVDTPTPVPGDDCAGVPVWTAQDIYPNGGMRVQYNGNLYDNNWYTQNQNPEQNSGPYMVWNLLGSCEGGPVDTPTPTPEPTPTPITGDASVWLSPANQTVTAGDNFTTAIHINSGSQLVAAYGIFINYNSGIIEVNTGIGNNGVDPGANGFVSAVNPTTGSLRISGFDAMGVGPGSDLEIAIANWIAVAVGSTALDVIVDSLTDEGTNAIIPDVSGANVVVEPGVVDTPTPTPTPVGDTPTPTPTPVTDTPTPTPTPTPVTDTPTPTPTPVSGESCDGVPVWTANNIYPNAGMRVQYNGNLYDNNWYTQNQNPEQNSGQYEVWNLIGPCGGGPVDTPTPVPVDTPTPVPGDDCAGVPVWTAQDIYPNGGMRVQYNGNLYDNNWYTQNQNPEQNSGPYMVWNLLGSCEGGPVDTPTPTPEPTPTPITGDASVWLSPANQTVTAGDNFTTAIHINSGSQLVAAYGIFINYNSGIIEVNTGIGNNGVDPGANGFVSAVNPTTGSLRISGFDAMGVGPGSDLEIAIANWIAVAVGSTALDVIVDSLTDEGTNAIIPDVSGANVVVEPGVVDTPTPTPVADTPTPTPVADTPTPTPVIVTGGRVWMVPASQQVAAGSNFTNEIHVDSGSQMLAAYGIFIDYNNNIVDVNAAAGNNGVDTGADGFVSAVNDTPGQLRISGFDAMGKGPGADLQLAIINWTGVAQGTTTLTVIIDSLTDNMTNTIGNPSPENGSVTVLEGETPIPTETPTPVPTETPTPESTEEPTPEPAATPNTGVVGAVWLDPYDITVSAGSTFDTQIRVNSGTQRLAAYGIDLQWDPAIISYNAYAVGTEGYLSAMNPHNEGVLVTSGFDAMGKGPGNMHLLTITFNALSAGATDIIVIINDLADNMISPIGTATPNNGYVTVQ